MVKNAPIVIGGIVPLTTIDFPGALACVVFCQGCTWKCRYCHNSHLQPFHKVTEKDLKTWNNFYEFIEDRRGFLDAVVFSGGEPTSQPGLLDAIQTVKKLGFKIGLHTAGPDPSRLHPLLPFVDWIGFDVKSPFDDRYKRISGGHAKVDQVLESLMMVVESGVPYQIRTTVHSTLLSNDDVEEIQEFLTKLGAQKSVIQPFRPDGCVDQELRQFTGISRKE